MGGIYFFYLKAPPKTYFFVFLFIVAIYRRVDFSDVRLILLLIFIVVFIFLIQYLIFRRGTLTNLLGYIIPILNSFLIIKLLGNKFFNYFVNVVYFLAIIGLFFWLLENISPEFNNSIKKWVSILGTDPSVQKESLILFAYEPNKIIGGLIRNNGGFWEPGAYVTTLVPAFLFSSIIYGLKNKKSIIILIAILTTFSTTGYIALFVVFIYYIVLSSYNSMVKYFLIITFVSLSVFAYYALDFLSGKIEYNIEFVQKADFTTAANGRFLALKKSGYAIQQHPLIGKNFITLRGKEINYYAKDWVGYGWMDLMAKIGILFFIWYLFINYNFYKKLVRANNYTRFNYKFLALLPFLAQYILLFGQALYAVPLFMIFLEFPLLYKYSNIYKIKK